MALEHDVIVVGSGPAGVGCALHAARSGLSVLLLDKARFPRDKLCGETLSSASVHEIDLLGLLPEMLARPHVRVDLVSYFAPYGEQVTVPLARIDKKTPVASIICRRVILDDMLLQVAKQHVDVMEGCHVRGMLLEDGRARGVRADIGEGRELWLRGKVVVGADGFPSSVGRQMRMPGYPLFRAMSARAYYSPLPLQPGHMEVFYPEEILPGFCWIHRTDGIMANVGLTMPMDIIRKKRIAPQKALEAAISFPAVRDRFKYSERIGKIQAAVLPVANPMREVHGEGFLLVGDAAGVINPCSMEGISNALQSGRIAAEILAELHAQNAPMDEPHLRGYALRLWEELGPATSMANQLLGLRTPKAIASLIRSASRRPRNAGWISGILTGSAVPSEEVDTLLHYLRYFSK
ncbi:geranylgeranyl reductase family protein [Desulfonatronum thioautotrophicum]|uniref:geranylgeranyl reductase family protein n=1 Tax=Desulfonatronum thioautotrophicum TaxID=617001 RepID=UPI0005EAEA81|nr:geranylgeranyl reductase family protein [Desulfonatronum thioautotrophicum]